MDAFERPRHMYYHIVILEVKDIITVMDFGRTHRHIPFAISFILQFISNIDRVVHYLGACSTLGAD
jgi:hypothetical protein